MTLLALSDMNAERKWKKDKLQVSFEMLRDCWRHANCHKPRVLFKTIDSVFNAQTVCMEASPALCEKCFFQVSSARALIAPSTYDPSISFTCSAVFDQFEPVTLSCLQETVGQLRTSGSPNDSIPRLFKEVFPTVGISLLTIINSSLHLGVVPENFKHAVVQPLIKKPGLDPAALANFRPISKILFL